MASLLIQSCSNAKEHTDKAVPAIDLYDGYFFRIIKKAMREGQFDPKFDILIISAKYGVIEPEEKIHYYDRLLGKDQAQEWNEMIVDDIAKKTSGMDYKEIWVNTGKRYLATLDGVEEVVDGSINYISGDGIGIKGSQLKNLIRTRHQNVTRG